MLKLLAILTMVIDHLGYVFFPDQEWMRAIGRLTMPIFAYAIARGFFYTRSKKRYLIQLSILALVSQIPFMLLFEQGWTLNMVVPWALAVVALMSPLWVTPLLAFIPLLLEIPMDYTSLVILLPVAIYHLWFNNRRPLLAALAVVTVLSVIAIASPWYQWLALLAIPLILLVEPYDAKVKVNKWFFYAFYPVHMALLYGVKLLVV
jgi:hypothetical protein